MAAPKTSAFSHFSRDHLPLPANCPPVPTYAERMKILCQSVAQCFFCLGASGCTLIICTGGLLPISVIACCSFVLFFRHRYEAL